MTRYLIPLGIFVVLVVFLGIGLGLNPREVPSPLVGKPAPAFRLAELHGNGKVRGKAVMLTREKVAMLQQDWAADDTKRAWDDLGWKPETSFTDGLKKTADWYRENGWL